MGRADDRAHETERGRARAKAVDAAFNRQKIESGPERARASGAAAAVGQHQIVARVVVISTSFPPE